MDKLTITKADDWHLHLRDGELMQSVVNESARHYKRALIMPNLSEPVTTVDRALAYHARIVNALHKENSFEPMMALYLTADTTASEIQRAKNESSVLAVKMFPAGATTNSSFGIQTIDQCDTVFEEMQRLEIPLSIHGEVVDPAVDIFDREKVFVETVLKTIIDRYPELKIVLEHITTKEAAQFVEEQGDQLAATITIHHLLLNRNDLLVGGIHPHHYCLPVVKSEKDRQKITEAAVSGNKKFFLGSDSAPHPQKDKEASSGKAGIYSASVSLLLYLGLFEELGALDKFEGFASFFGADFYGLPRSSETITLVRKEVPIPDRFMFGNESIVPLMAGRKLKWTLA